MSAFVVDPAVLLTPARTCERAAESLAAVARAVVGVEVPTGRGDTVVAAVQLLQLLGATVQRMAEDARTDAGLLASASERYAAAEHRALAG